MWSVWTLFLAAFGLWWYFKKQNLVKRSKGLKRFPGPRGFPIIGNIHQLGSLPNKQYSKWADQYGPMYQVQLGGNLTVVVSDPKLTKEIFSTNNTLLTGRIQIPELNVYEDSPGLGIFNSEGERWEVHRRFLLRQLRDFGFGKSSMETLIMEEVKEVISLFQRKCGEPISKIRDTLRLAMVNSLWTIMSSERFSHDDPKLFKLATDTTKTFDTVFERGGLLIFMPWVKHVIPELSGYNIVRRNMADNRDCFDQTIENHKQTFNEHHLRDFIDVYLAEMKKHENDPKSMFYGKTAERQLVATLADLFLAGSDSTATTLAWSVMYLCKFPEIQKKLQAEIEKVTGNTRHVLLDDRSQMPYAMATLDEILRYSSIAADGVPHKAMADCEFQGYFIPKDTLILSNIYYIHRNPKLWGDPEKFRPERFLTEDGKTYVKSPNLQPFSVGRRACAGEPLARDTIFLYLTNVFQKFEVQFDPNQPDPTLEGESGFIRSPATYSVVIKER